MTAVIGVFGCAGAARRTNVVDKSSGRVSSVTASNQVLAVQSDTALIQGLDFGGGFNLVAHPTRPLIIRGNDADLLLQDTRSAAIQAVLPGALSDLRAIALRPDGQAVYTGDVAGELAVWDLASGRRTTLGKEPGALFEIAFDSGGEAFVTSGREYTHYYLRPGALPRALFGSSLSEPGFVLGGKYLVGRDPSLKVIEVASGAVVASMSGGGRWNPSWAQGPRGNQVVWIGPDDTLFIADLPLLTNSRRVVQVPGAAYLHGSADGSRLLVGAGNKQVVLLDSEGRSLQSYAEASNSVIGFSPSGQRFALEYERHLTVYDSHSGDPLRDFRLDNSPGDIVWCGDETCLAVAQSRAVNILNLQSGAVIRAASPQKRISEISFHPDGRFVDLEEHFAGHHLIDALTGKALRAFPVPTLLGASEAFEDLSFSPSGVHYAAGTHHVLDVVNMSNGSHQRLTEDPSFSAVRQARFSPDGVRVVVLGDRSGEAFIAEAATGKELLRVSARDRDTYFTAAFSPNGEFLALAGRHAMRIVNSTTGAPVLDTEIPSLAMGLAWLDAERVISGHDRGELLVWSLRAGPHSQAVDGDRRHVNRIAVSSDRRWVAAIIGRYHRVDLIDAATLKVVRQLHVPSGEATDLEWHPCRPLLGVAHGDATFFDVEAGTWLRVALLGEEESSAPPEIAVTRSDGRAGGTPSAMPFMWVRHGGPLGSIEPFTRRPDLITTEIGQPWFAGCPQSGSGLPRQFLTVPRQPETLAPAPLQQSPRQSPPAVNRFRTLEPRPRLVLAPACTAADWTPRKLPPLLRVGSTERVGYSTSIVEDEGDGIRSDLLGDSPCEDAPRVTGGYPNNLGRELDNGVVVALSGYKPAGKSGRGWPGNQCGYQITLADGSGSPVTLGSDVIPPFTSIYAVVRKGAAAWIGVQFNGYAREFPKGGCFVVAVDLCEGKVLWKSSDYTSNGDIVLVGDDYLVTGYGFTAEKRIIQVRDAHSGKVVQTLQIPGNPEEMRFHQGLLTVKTNHGDATFELLK